MGNLVRSCEALLACIGYGSYASPGEWTEADCTSTGPILTCKNKGQVTGLGVSHA